MGVVVVRWGCGYVFVWGVLASLTEEAVSHCSFRIIGFLVSNHGVCPYSTYLTPVVYGRPPPWSVKALVHRYLPTQWINKIQQLQAYYLVH
jgi:hypothetical protein